MAVVLADQVGLSHIGGDVSFPLAAPVFSRVHKVIVGVHILEQAAPFVGPDAAGRPRRV